MSYLVYHNAHFINFGLGELTNDSIFTRVDARQLSLVAKVNAADLNEVFHATNHIDRSWWRNPQIVWWRPARSTSVGDIILDMDTNSYWTVENIGFHPIYRLQFHLLEKDLPDEPQIFIDIFAIDRSPTARLRRMVLRQLQRIRTSRLLSRL